MTKKDSFNISEYQSYGYKPCHSDRETLDYRRCNKRNEINDLDSCASRELIKNGGFETLGLLTTFADWEEEESEFLPVSTDNVNPYEGRFNARFQSMPQLPEDTNATTRIYQTVNVAPGCHLTLSFAERIFAKPLGIILFYSARVYYMDGDNEVDLIEIEKITARLVGFEESSFSYHEKTSDIPVPPNVNNVIVEFKINVQNLEPVTNSAIFFLDGVSIRQSR